MVITWYKFEINSINLICNTVMFKIVPGGMELQGPRSSFTWKRNWKLSSGGTRSLNTGSGVNLWSLQLCSNQVTVRWVISNELLDAEII